MSFRQTTFFMLTNATIEVKLLSFSLRQAYAFNLQENSPISWPWIVHTRSLSKYWSHLISNGLFNFIGCISLLFRFKLPMLHIVGVSSCSEKNLYSYLFRPSEKKTKLGSIVKGIFSVNQLPEIIARYRELALMAALRTHFLNAQKLLCVWHISKNALANCRKDFLS